MALARSKITAQGQISVPARIRKKLGVGPGSVLEWEEAGNDVVLRRVGQYSFEDVHLAVFGTKTPRRRTIEQMDEGKRRRVQERYARR